MALTLSKKAMAVKPSSTLAITAKAKDGSNTKASIKLKIVK